MYKYKKFYIPLIFSLLLILTFSLISNTNTSGSNVISSGVLKTKDELTFYIASDIHYLSDSINDKSTAFQKFYSRNDGKQLDYIPQIVDTLIYNIKETKPDFLILSGDLTLNGEKESHVAFASKLDEIKKSGTSVYVIPGNHDINNPWARGFSSDDMFKVDSVSPKDFATIYKDFGYKEAISKDKSSLSYLVAPSKDLWLLMLDDNNYNNNFKYNMPDMSGEISKGTLDWIKKCSSLAKEKNAKIVAVSHHNLVNHSNYIWDGYTLDNSNEVLDVFKECKISLAFSGHIHLQSIKNYSSGDYSLYDISNASLSVYPQKYGILKYSTGGNLSFNTSRLDVDNWSKTFGLNDDNLLNFNDFSKSYYDNFVYNQNYRGLSKTSKFSLEEVNEICETIRNIRLKYDADLDTLTWDDIRSSNGFKLLQTCDSPYLKHYVNIAVEGNEEENNRIELVL